MENKFADFMDRHSFIGFILMCITCFGIFPALVAGLAVIISAPFLYFGLVGTITLCGLILAGLYFFSTARSARLS